MFFILGDPGAVKILLKFSTNFFKSKFQETLPMIMTNKITKALLLIIGMNENENDYAMRNKTVAWHYPYEELSDHHI